MCILKNEFKFRRGSANIPHLSAEPLTVLLVPVGVASGKCGFTTIRNFQYKKPDFPSPKLRN
ncbi:hypothetical protein DZB84_20790 [Bacillus sp. HNG]|nr:hypothetical protein DZB84_20790 [Bacillus sp. HNG]